MYEIITYQRRVITFQVPFAYVFVSRIFLSIIWFFVIICGQQRDPRNREIQLVDLGNSYMECQA